MIFSFFEYWGYSLPAIIFAIGAYVTPFFWGRHLMKSEKLETKAKGVLIVMRFWVTTKVGACSLAALWVLWVTNYIVSEIYF